MKGTRIMAHLASKHGGTSPLFRDGTRIFLREQLSGTERGTLELLSFRQDS